MMSFLSSTISSVLFLQLKAKLFIPLGRIYIPESLKMTLYRVCLKKQFDDVIYNVIQFCHIVNKDDGLTFSC